MAGFKTHISTSTALGAVYGAAGHVNAGIPLETCLLATGLCSIAGMLPDLDSESGVPIRETTAFTAAVTPMLMIDRFQHLRLSHESIVLAGVCIYIIIRFGLAELLRRYTVHRGMWHSIPAAVCAGLAATLICSCGDMRLLLFKSGAVMLGYVTHLLLDELYSIHWHRGRLRFKSSFGTAMKFFSRSIGANVVAYGVLLLLAMLALNDPRPIDRHMAHDPPEPRVARDVGDHLFEDARDSLAR